MAGKPQNLPNKRKSQIPDVERFFDLLHADLVESPPTPLPDGKAPSAKGAKHFDPVLESGNPTEQAGLGFYPLREPWKITSRAGGAGGFKSA